MVKKYKMDPNASWEERYRQLEAHHVEETEALYRNLKFARKMLQELNDTRCGNCKAPPKFPSIETDEAGRKWLDEIVDEMMTKYSISQQEAIERVSVAWRGTKIVGDHIVYHETPLYWASAIYTGRRDWWRKEGESGETGN